MMKQQGFTLLELSIVLVIIGLIAGGVIAGQEMIKAAELRSVIKDANELKTATYAFKEKYGYYPGDFNQASSFWTSCTDNGVNRCNGNGDNIITHVDSLGLAGIYEVFRGIQHLSLGGFIPGNYTAADTHELGVNVKPSAITGGGFYLSSSRNTGAAIFGRAGNYIRLGSASAYSRFFGGSLSSRDAWSIDGKIDDGFADKGNIMAFRGANVAAPACVSNNWSAPSANYLLGSDIAAACTVVFFLD